MNYFKKQQIQTTKQVKSILIFISEFFNIAMYNLAINLQNGIGLEKNIKKANKLLEKASKLGYSYGII